MANVFTKRHHRPRTTTLRDFSLIDKPSLPRRPRIWSPTRRVNPHPTGLVYQSAYNRDNSTFDIWNPDFVKIARRMPEMVAHLERANFCSGPYQPPLRNKSRPKIKYTLNSVSRISYQTPHLPDINQQNLKTRFGYTPYNPASGIVPNTLRPIYRPSQLKMKDSEKSQEQ